MRSTGVLARRPSLLHHLAQVLVAGLASSSNHGDQVSFIELFGSFLRTPRCPLAYFITGAHRAPVMLYALSAFMLIK